MSAILPPVPRFVFCIVEPITLLAGALGALIDPYFFVNSQLAHERPHKLYPTELVLTFQLGSIYFLLLLIGVGVLNTTTESKVVKAYLWALWFADITHVGGTAYVTGWDHFVDWRTWNATAWGNIGITTTLFLFRSLYLAGLLGQDKSPAGKRKKKQ